MPIEPVQGRLRLLPPPLNLCQLPGPSSGSQSKLPGESKALSGVQTSDETETGEPDGLELTEYLPSLPNQNQTTIQINNNQLPNLHSLPPLSPLPTPLSSPMLSPYHERSLGPRVIIHDTIHNAPSPDPPQSQFLLQTPCQPVKKLIQWNILSLNCAKSQASSSFILQYAAALSNTIMVCLQEPALDKQGHPPTHPSFTCYSPSIRPKCCTYIRTSSDQQVTVVLSEESCFLGCRVSSPNYKSFTVYNIYSKGGRDIVLAKLLKSPFVPEQSCIMIGDFNCKHPWWIGNAYAHRKHAIGRYTSTNANDIVGWLDMNNFSLQNKPGIFTHYPRSSGSEPSTIDLCFTRGEISKRTNGWTIDHESISDHSIIGLRLCLNDLRTPINPAAKQILCWKKTNWEEFNAIIKSSKLDFSNLGSGQETSRAIDAIYQTLYSAIDTSVPKTTIRPKFAPWWTKNLEWLTGRLKRAKKRAIKSRTNENANILERIQNTWEKAIRSAKHKLWATKTKDISRTSIWTVAKRHTMAHTRAVPSLDGAETFEEKCAKLWSTIFPPNPNTNISVPLDFVQSKADLTDNYSTVSRAEVKRALESANKNSAVGEDRINYSVILKFDEAAPSALPQVVSALLYFGLHDSKWKHAICVVIPKGGNRNFQNAKSYRPISLLSCLGKLVEKIAARRIAKAGEICGAISTAQFGSRSSHSAIDALFKTFANLEPYIGPENTRNLRPSLAAHDVDGAFNNTIPSALISIMELRKMPKYLIEWVKNFTESRTMSFSFDNCQEIKRPFVNAIPQGSPVSPALFSIMMSAILDDPDLMSSKSEIAYVDDISETIAGRATEISSRCIALGYSYTAKAHRAKLIGLTFSTENQK